MAVIIPRLPAQLHHPVAPAAPAAVAQPAIDSPVYLENYMFRIGFGYDVHCLVEGRRLILGGVDIPWECGLLGHCAGSCNYGWHTWSPRAGGYRKAFS